MKIQLASDIHFETHADEGKAFLAQFQNAGADVLVLAGDICPTRLTGRLATVIADAASKWKDVIYVMGNHESWGNSLPRSIEQAHEVCEKHPNVHFLNNQGLWIEKGDHEVKFFGGTGWFEDTKDASLKLRWPDYGMIEGLAPKIYEMNDHFAEEAYAGGPHVVVSHHMPSEACVQPEYAGDPSNHFYYGNFDVERVEPELWLFGHTHSQVDMMIGRTRVVCNPYGYPKEKSRPKFQPGLVLEVVGEKI